MEEKNEKLVRVGLQPLFCRYNSRISLLSGRTITVGFCSDIRAEKDIKGWPECPGGVFCAESYTDLTLDRLRLSRI